MAELAKQYDVHPNQIANWKARLAEGAAGLAMTEKRRLTEPRKTSRMGLAAAEDTTSE